MAEIQQQAAGGSKPGKRRAKKMSTRIDMTPMVDLAFLLLTFFMLTTTFARPYTMELNMPVKPKIEGPTEVAASKAMTVVLGAGHRVYYYAGLNPAANATAAKPELHTTTFGAAGIRQAIRERQRRTPGLVVLIKPTAESKYQDMVDILDEMNITKQPKYALVKITQDDLNLLQNN
ncbi:biopolymer transporter ExbD [Hymenobacter agri]